MFCQKLALAHLRRIVRVLAVRLRRQEDVRNRVPRVVRAPGVMLHRTAKFLLTRDAHRRYVEPVIADMQHEYFEAIVAGREWSARWIALRGHVLVIPGWLFGLLAHAQRRLFKSYKL